MRADDDRLTGYSQGEFKPVLYVADVETSAPFYRDVLGFAFEGFANSEGHPYYAELAAAGVKFGLHEPTSTGQVARIGQDGHEVVFAVTDAERHSIDPWNAEAPAPTLRYEARASDLGYLAIAAAWFGSTTELR